MSKKKWHDDIPKNGVLCRVDGDLQVIKKLSKNDIDVYERLGVMPVPLTAAEWWDFAPWQDVKDAPRDGSGFMALTKGKVCTVFFEAEDDSFITDFKNNGDFYRVFDFKWLPLPQVSA